MISCVRGSPQVQSDAGRCWGTKSGGCDSVRKLEQMDHKPQRRWRWGKKGPWLSRVGLGDFRSKRQIVTGRVVRRKDG